MLHNNRFAEFDRLHVLSDGLTGESDVEALLPWLDWAFGEIRTAAAA